MLQQQCFDVRYLCRNEIHLSFELLEIVISIVELDGRAEVNA